MNMPQSIVPSQSGIHIVQAGETLAVIAGRYGVPVEQLAAANALTNPNAIYAGQQLLIPQAAPPPAGFKVHVVQPNDTLSTIAAAYSVALKDVIAANKITNPNLLRVGQSLLIPLAQNTGYTNYTVQTGEILSQIAARYGISLELLATINGIYPPYPVAPGQVIRVPVSGSQPPPGNYVSHTVQPGEYLLSIAARYGVSLEVLAAANNIRPPYLTSPGQTLRVPTSGGGGTQYVNHTVQPGEYMLAIALKYGVSLDALAAANNIRPPYLTSPGQVLRVPKAGATGASSGATQPVAAPQPPATLPGVTPAAQPASGGRTHTVQPGEYFLAIALKYGVSVEALATANGLQPPYAITPGQVLRIP